MVYKQNALKIDINSRIFLNPEQFVSLHNPQLSADFIQSLFST